MAITAAVCNSFKQEVYVATHNFTNSTGDVFKFALYLNSATLDKSTTAYTTSGEHAATGGYTAGGMTLTNTTPLISTDSAVLDFADISWTSATITARGALIYNTSKSNKSVLVLDFGTDVSSTNGTFQIVFPPAAAATGLIVAT